MNDIPNLDKIRLRMLQARETYVDRETLREWFINDVLKMLARIRRAEEALTQETRVSVDFQEQRDAALAEVKRLNTANQNLRNALVQNAEERDAALAEVERLQGYIRLNESSRIMSVIGERNAALAEVEELKRELEWLTQLAEERSEG